MRLRCHPDFVHRLVEQHSVSEDTVQPNVVQSCSLENDAWRSTLRSCDKNWTERGAGGAKFVMHCDIGTERFLMDKEKLVKMIGISRSRVKLLFHVQGSSMERLILR